MRPRGASLRPRGHGRIRADAPCFTPSNFKKDATVRPSHGAPAAIVRSSVRPFENVRVTTMAPACDKTQENMGAS
jgi:hypothetical protein